MSDSTFPEVSTVEPMYEPKDAIGNSITNGVMLGGAGLFLAAVQSTVAKENIGMFGIFSRFGSSTALFGGYIFAIACTGDADEKYSGNGRGIRLC